MNFNFVVNYCSTMDAEFGTKSECYNNTYSAEYLANVRVQHKFLTQYFSAGDYQGSIDSGENGMLYIAECRMNFDMLPGQTS